MSFAVTSPPHSSTRHLRLAGLINTLVIWLERQVYEVLKPVLLEKAKAEARLVVSSPGCYASPHAPSPRRWVPRCLRSTPWSVKGCPASLPFLLILHPRPFLPGFRGLAAAGARG